VIHGYHRHASKINPYWIGKRAHEGCAKTTHRIHAQEKPPSMGTIGASDQDLAGLLNRKACGLLYVGTVVVSKIT
jgi:hypothetical protein